jgi:hypothetical protein
MTLAGCSTGSAPSPPASPPSARSLITDVQRSFRHVESVRITGHIRIHGRTLRLDLRMFRWGDMKGTLTVNGTSIAVVSVGGRAYAYITKADFKYLGRSRNIAPFACAVICGKYLRLPRGVFRQLSLAKLSRMMGGKVRLIGRKARVKSRKTRRKAPALRVRQTTYMGHPAYELASGGVEAFIAENGPHYLLALINRAKLGAIRFSEWNAVPLITAPPASKIISITS